MSDDTKNEDENILKLHKFDGSDMEEVSDTHQLLNDIADLIQTDYGHLSPEEVLGALVLFQSMMIDAVKYHMEFENE
jgi:hypothetical protein